MANEFKVLNQDQRNKKKRSLRHAQCLTKQAGCRHPEHIGTGSCTCDSDTYVYDEEREIWTVNPTKYNNRFASSKQTVKRRSAREKVQSKRLRSQMMGKVFDRVTARYELSQEKKASSADRTVLVLPFL